MTSRQLYPGILSTFYSLTVGPLSASGEADGLRLREAGGLSESRRFRRWRLHVDQGISSGLLLPGRPDQPRGLVHRRQHRRGQRPIHQGRQKELLRHRTPWRGLRAPAKQRQAGQRSRKTRRPGCSPRGKPDYLLWGESSRSLRWRYSSSPSGRGNARSKSMSSCSQTGRR